MNQSSIEEYLNNQRKLIDSSIQHFLEETRQTSMLFTAISYSIFSGGKRIRPILVTSVYEMVHGKINESCIIPACALEFIHTYSLIHDDLPCMDNSDTRRGKPSTHKLYGEDIALLAGDALLTEAFYLLTCERARQLYSPETGISLIYELSKLSGIAGMVEGQAFEMMQDSTSIKEETIHYIIDLKTAALFDASLRIGGISAGLNKEEQNKLGSIGRLFGFAFQLADDLHDYLSENQEINYVKLMGKEHTINLLNKTMEECINFTKALSFNSNLLQEIWFHFWKKEFLINLP